MIINDLVPINGNLKTLFILESPFKEEINYGYPCAGKTGTKMSHKIINPKISKPFGSYLKENDKKYEEYGIMNTFQFPLELPKELDHIQLKYTKLKTLTVSDKLNRQENYTVHFECLNNFPNFNEEITFSTRLKNYIANSKHLVNLIVCGYIAQSVFIKTTKIENNYPKFNVLEDWETASGKKVKVLFVNHPSDPENDWAFRLSSLASKRLNL